MWLMRLQKFSTVLKLATSCSISSQLLLRSVSKYQRVHSLFNGWCGSVASCSTVSPPIGIISNGPSLSPVVVAPIMLSSWPCSVSPAPVVAVFIVVVGPALVVASMPATSPVPAPTPASPPDSIKWVVVGVAAVAVGCDFVVVTVSIVGDPHCESSVAQAFCSDRGEQAQLPVIPQVALMMLL